MTSTAATKAATVTSDTRGKYLFVYFTGNEPCQEQISYAVSDDGFNYTPLNGGKPIVASDTIALTGCVRDPHILRTADGQFLMVATDMRSSLGWASNRGIVMMTSRDLIHWRHHTVHFPTRFAGTPFANVTRVWAPQTIYDDKAGKYMVYFSLLTSDGSIPYDRVYWAYANADFSGLEGEPQMLFDFKAPAIDTDIVRDSTGEYHLFFKTEQDGAHKGIRQYVFRDLHDPKSWTLLDGFCEQTKDNVEGAGVFPLIGGGWCLMYDCYMSGHYQFTRSTDLRKFHWVADTKTTGAFTPRHGTVMQITHAEYEALVAGLAAQADSKTVTDLPRNPILPGFHADPEIMYSNLTHRYYVYSTTDGLPGWGGYTYRCFSSADLKEWRDEGDVLNAKDGQVAWADGNLWAPAIQEVKVGDGRYKYYLYYSANPKAGGGKQIGVAVADSPTGPFRDHGKPIITDSPKGCHGQQIDVDVFVDPQSGKPYIYWGNGYMAVAELRATMTSTRRRNHKVITPQGGTLADYAYREAPYVFYRKGTYYFMWSVDDTGSPNYHVAYGTSKSPLGPIKVAKNPVVLRQNPERAIYGTAHNSVINLPGTDKWYIVYHRINKDHVAPGKEPGTHREVCIDPIEFADDGSILPVKCH